LPLPGIEHDCNKILQDASSPFTFRWGMEKISAKGLIFSNRTKFGKKRKLLTYILKSPLRELQTFIFSKYFKPSVCALFIIVYVHEL